MTYIYIEQIHRVEHILLYLILIPGNLLESGYIKNMVYLNVA